MSALIYVQDINGNLVPAEFLTDNGSPIVDPNTAFYKLNIGAMI